MMETYKHSGRSGAIGVPLTTLLGLGAAVALGFVYAYVINWIPLIYVNFFATIGFGVALGLAVGWAATTGKMRNTALVGVLGFLMGLAGLYVAWAVDPLARGQTDGILWHPQHLWAYIQYFYDNGFWGIGRAGGLVSGIFLGLVWVAEAAIIVGAATMFAVGFVADQPFCEDCNAWTNQEEGVAHLDIPTDEENSPLERVLSGDVSALDEMIRSGPGAPAFLRLDLATCPSCTESNYLTVQLTTHTVNKKGEVSTNTEALVKNMLIAEQDIPRVRDAGVEPPQDTDDVAPEGEPDANDEGEGPADED